ncbi:MAG: cold shock domain-containing protein [Bacteroidota bacterium]
MGKSKESFNKKEREKKRRKKKLEKQEKRALRKAEKSENKEKPKTIFSYVDEDGNLTSTPPDPAKKQKIKAEDIVIGIPPKEEIPEEAIKKGKVKFFNDDKGYGFIIDNSTGESIFVHVNDCAVDLQENDQVTFEVEMGPKGPKAVNVVLAGQ